jgi:hypothetical protein
MSDEIFLPVTSFYEQHADLYAALAKDRDFKKESRSLIECVKCRGQVQPSSAVELFAGPAWHALAWQDEALKTYAIDASFKMAEIAQANRFPRDQYIVGYLPAAIQLLPGSVDVAAAMRYSIGYLDRDEIMTLLINLRSNMRIGSSVFFELHQLDVIASGLSALSIRTRRFLMPDGRKAECVWPDGKLQWNREDWIVSMTVSICLEGNRDHPIYQFRSTERIHTVRDFRQAAEQLGNWRICPLDPLLENTFTQSEIVHLEAV